MATVTKNYTDHVERAYAELVGLSKVCGGVTASIKSCDNANVPSALVGEFVVTGAKDVHTATNLARAIVVLGAVHNTQSVWHVTSLGRKLVVRK